MSRAKNLFSVPVATSTNRTGYASYQRSIEEEFLQTLLTNTIGNTFYASSSELLQESDQVHNAMLQADPEFYAKALVFARTKGFMRLQPILGLAKLACTNTELFKKVFNQVVLIPSDLSDFMTIIEGMGRGQGGRAIKKTVSKWLTEKTSEYWAIKYNGRGRGYSLGDIIATTHPKPTGENQSTLFKYLMGKEVDVTSFRETHPQVYAYEMLKVVENDEQRVHWIKEGRLPHEVATGVVTPNKDIWNAILEQMPIFALLRNLNTLDRAGVLNERMDYVTQRLTDQNALSRSKIFPFRFLTAFNHVTNQRVKDALRQAVELTFSNLPDINGRTAILLDKSGSMGMHRSLDNSNDNMTVASVIAFALYKKTNGNAVFYTFNTMAYNQDVSLYDSILTQASRIRADGGTNTGSGVRKLIDNNERVDNIIIITDEQQNSGRSFYSELTNYRNRVNRDVKAFIVDISPNRSYMTPQTDAKTNYIFGWSDQVLQYISLESSGLDNMVSSVRNLEI